MLSVRQQLYLMSPPIEVIFFSFPSEIKNRCYTRRNITCFLPAGTSCTELLQTGANILSVLKTAITYKDFIQIILIIAKISQNINQVFSWFSGLDPLIFCFQIFSKSLLQIAGHVNFQFIKKVNNSTYF